MGKRYQYRRTISFPPMIMLLIEELARRSESTCAGVVGEIVKEVAAREGVSVTQEEVDAFKASAREAQDEARRRSFDTAREMMKDAFFTP